MTSLKLSGPGTKSFAAKDSYRLSIVISVPGRCRLRNEKVQHARLKIARDKP
jgi:hypothetical protein